MKCLELCPLPNEIFVVELKSPLVPERIKNRRQLEGLIIVVPGQAISKTPKRG